MKKSLLEHLIELRLRLIYIFLALGGGVAVSYPLAPTFFCFLTKPLVYVMGGGRRLIYTGLTEAFLTYLKLSFFSGFILALPFILWQCWLFISPGLYLREKKVFFLLSLASPILFISGAALAYYVICPVAWKFFLSFEIPASSQGVSLQLEARMGEYLSLILKLIFAFGICFQLPLILVGLHKVGLVTLTTLKANRKYAFLIIVIVAAIMTPPDIISPLGLIIPLYALYEISISLIKFSLRTKDISHA